MDLNTYYKLIYSENMARKYLLGKYFKNHQRICPRCRERKLYKLKEGRYRCSHCDYTFHDFSGRWINQGRLTCIQWLSLIKLFELEVSVRKMALQLNVSYRAVYRAGHSEPRRRCPSPARRGGRVGMKPTSGVDVKATEGEEPLAKFLYSASWSETVWFM